MFKAKKAGTPAFRRRAVSDEDGSEEQAPTAAVDPPLSAAPTAAQSKKLKRPKPSKAALSFGGDEEGEDAEVFTVKKRQQGVTAKKRSKAAPVALDDASAAAQAGSVTSSSWHSSTAGMYSAEGMAALRKSQPFQIAAANSGSAMDVADDEDFAAAEAGTEAVLTGDAAALAFETEADSTAAGPSSRSPTADSSSRNLALPLRNGEQRSSSSRDDGFIAFDDSMPVPGQASSRTSAARARAHAAAFAEDDDEELQQQWEAEQVQRGGGGGTGESQNRSLLQQRSSLLQQQQLALAARVGEAVTVEAMQKALRTSTAALRESVEQGLRAASKLETELQAVTVSAKELQHSTAAAGALYEAFQRTRDALADLCGMLRAKESMISEVAAARAALSAQRLRTVLQRRAETAEGEIADIRRLSPGAVEGVGGYTLLKEGPLALAARPGGDTTAGDWRVTRQKRLQSKRSRQRTTATAGNATAATTTGTATAAGVSGSGEQYKKWGLTAEQISAVESGGEESAGEEQEFRERSQTVLHAAELILEDVDEDVKSLRTVKLLFEQWKRDYSEQYARAYASLSLPQLLVPL
eukprot:10965-Heterococcus_DN1.PRE.1